MIKKNSSGCQVPATYDEFKKKFMPLAMYFIKSQNLFFATFSDQERAEMAIDDAYMKIGTFDPKRGVKFTTYIYTILKNILNTVQPYDKNRARPNSSSNDEDGSSAIIKSASKFKILDNLDVLDENISEENNGDAYSASMEVFERGLECIDGKSIEIGFNPYDKDDCFLLSFTIAQKELSKTEQLILTGDKREYVRVNGVLHNDREAWEDFYKHKRGTVVFKGPSRDEIGKILNYSAENVGYIRNSLAHKLAISMSEIFKKIYLGPDPQRTFNRMLNKYKGGKKIVSKHKLSL